MVSFSRDRTRKMGIFYPITRAGRESGFCACKRVVLKISIYLEKDACFMRIIYRSVYIIERFVRLKFEYRELTHRYSRILHLVISTR